MITFFSKGETPAHEREVVMLPSSDTFMTKQ